MMISEYFISICCGASSSLSRVWNYKKDSAAAVKLLSLCCGGNTT